MMGADGLHGLLAASDEASAVGDLCADASPIRRTALPYLFSPARLAQQGLFGRRTAWCTERLN